MRVSYILTYNCNCSHMTRAKDVFDRETNSGTLDKRFTIKKEHSFKNTQDILPKGCSRNGEKQWKFFKRWQSTFFKYFEQEATDLHPNLQCRWLWRLSSYSRRRCLPMQRRRSWPSSFPGYPWSAFELKLLKHWWFEKCTKIIKTKKHVHIDLKVAITKHFIWITFFRLKEDKKRWGKFSMPIKFHLKILLRVPLRVKDNESVC